MDTYRVAVLLTLLEADLPEALAQTSKRAAWQADDSVSVRRYAALVTGTDWPLLLTTLRNAQSLVAQLRSSEGA